jgi:hypothetical protein
VQGEALPWLETSLAIGGVALLFATLSRQPWWWRVIHAGFMPLVWFTQLPGHRPRLVPVRRHSAAARLSRRADRAGAALPLQQADGSGAGRTDRRTRRHPFLDLGAGVGSTTVPLADALPDSHFTGYENAPLTWLVGLLLGAGRPNIRWRWDDLWQADLGNYDVVTPSSPRLRCPGCGRRCRPK